LNINRKITIVIAFLLAGSATELASISNTVSDTIDYNDTSTEEKFKVLVTVAGVKRHCGEEVEITVAYNSETYQLCE
jgi:hypothetical protein